MGKVIEIDRYRDSPYRSPNPAPTPGCYGEAVSGDVHVAFPHPLQDVILTPREARFWAASLLTLAETAESQEEP